ncbi:MAG: CRISPR-associated primase-polymerase type B [Bacteroidales bacterium]|nr:CRISPR-associated primase-polymerase type B [Bacteroidales bacterium]
MLQTGKNITYADDQLKNVSIDYFANAICNPREEVKTQIRQLRMLQTLDLKKYAQFKKQLPYIVCSVFKPAFRRKSNFAHASYFILDLDHLSEKGLIASNIRSRIVTDKRVMLIFESPGGDGLKIMFKLKEKCFDSVKYSMFYKLFAKLFSEEHKIQQVIDTVTSDVTRACFVSHDPDIYYNQNCEPVDIDFYINFENLYSVKQLEQQIKHDEAEFNKSVESNDVLAKPTTISSDLLKEIKLKLNPNIRLKPEKNIVVSEALEDIIPAITELFETHHIKITKLTNINYGKKLNFDFNGKLAEINLFYGKRGYSVIQSPKNGMNNDLNELCHKILCEFFYGTK